MGGVGGYRQTEPRLVGHDRMADPRKRVRQQAAADEALGTARDRSGRRAKTIWQQKPQIRSQKAAGVREVVLTADLADDPVGKPRPIRVREADRPQYADAQRIELRESYRSDARGNVGLDDTKRIGAIVERPHVHGHVRPRRPRDALDESGEARIPTGKQNITTLEHNGEGLWISAWIRNGVLDRLRKVTGQRGK